MKEIQITTIENFRIGNAQNYQAGTGCTVLIFPKGGAAGVDIRGGGPASRETPLLNPVADAKVIHSVVLSGGSAFGLEAANGVMEYLEEKNIGFDVGITKVPLVCQSCIFDLLVGDFKVRPDKKMGYEACVNSEKNIALEGNVGAGTGATIGKLKGKDFALKSGLGIYAVEMGDLKVGAVMAVNALGDVYDRKGNIIGGMLNENKDGFVSSEEAMCNGWEVKSNLFTSNTTIGCVITNAKFNKAEMNKIAAMAQNGIARSVRPVHTTGDGDSIYAVSVGDVNADLNAVGTLAASVVSKAIERAVLNSEGMYGFKCAEDIK